MNYYVQQSIQIQFIKIGGMTNSSVFQIGTCGQVTSSSYLYNTGGYTKPAPKAEKGGSKKPPVTPQIAPLVPLQTPR